jgi:hypothetical protein
MKNIIIILLVLLVTSGCLSSNVAVSTKLTGSGKGGDKVRVFKKGDSTVIKISSKSGIGQFELAPIDGKWPENIILRFYLHGLESLQVNNGKFIISTSVISRSPYKQLCELSSDLNDKVFQVGEDSRCWMPLNIVNKKIPGHIEIPLEDGYIDATIPAVLFSENPEVIFVQWIDFYR